MNVKKNKPIRYKSATEKMTACAHALFCKSFGEYKCDAIHRRIYNAENECIGCKFHTRRASDDEIKFCHCENCMKQQFEDVMECKI